MIAIVVQMQVLDGHLRYVRSLLKPIPDHADTAQAYRHRAESSDHCYDQHEDDQRRGTLQAVQTHWSDTVT